MIDSHQQRLAVILETPEPSVVVLAGFAVPDAQMNSGRSLRERVTCLSFNLMPELPIDVPPDRVWQPVEGKKHWGLRGIDRHACEVLMASLATGIVVQLDCS